MAKANGSNERLTQNLANKAGATTLPAEKKDEITLGQMLQKMQKQVEKALPAHIKSEAFIRNVITTVRTTPKLQMCSHVSVLGALMTSAQLGLEPGPLGYVYWIPFKNKSGHYECTIIIGYQGYLDLIRRSGQVQSISVREVYKDDEFEFEYGLDEKLIHKPNLDVNPKDDDITHVYGIVRFKDGGHQVLVMSRKQIEAIRSRSKAANDGPWVTDWKAMALKTVVRQMWKFLPKSIEVQRALAFDDAVALAPLTKEQELDLTIDITPYHPEVPQEEPQAPAQAQEVAETKVVVEAPAKGESEG